MDMSSRSFVSAVLGSVCLLAGGVVAQEAKPAPATAANTFSVDAKLVMVPAVVSDKHGFVTNLTKDSFAISVDGKPQTVRYFDRDTDVPLTIGLLVDVSQSVASELDEEQKASQTFLDTMLQPASGKRPADKAFVMQFARTAELLQDVTESRPLLQAGLKEIGTQPPGSTDDTQQSSNSGNDNSNNGSNNPNNNPNNNGGYGRGGYGRGGYGRGNGGNNPSMSSRGGTGLY